MSQYLDRNQVIELYANYQPSLANHVYEFGEKLMALPIVEIPIAELDNTEDFGEWIDRSDGGRIRYPFWERYECSKCGAKYEDTNFCPNCGADMRVSKELNSEIEKSNSEIVPDYRDGWRLKEGDEK